VRDGALRVAETALVLRKIAARRFQLLHATATITSTTETCSLASEDLSLLLLELDRLERYVRRSFARHSAATRELLCAAFDERK
jgi:hypothetical protein